VHDDRDLRLEARRDHERAAADHAAAGSHLRSANDLQWHWDVGQHHSAQWCYKCGVQPNDNSLL